MLGFKNQDYLTSEMQDKRIHCFYLGLPEQQRTDTLILGKLRHYSKEVPVVIDCSMASNIKNAFYAGVVALASRANKMQSIGAGDDCLAQFDNSLAEERFCAAVACKSYVDISNIDICLGGKPIHN